MGRIRVLPESMINTIAAGEVVERPASVAKELIENAIDAEATAIAIRLEEGGRRLVEVIDDGCGMDGDDAVAALERHATSKLTADIPLDRVATLGFRGEALPSIAAVSRLTLVTGTGSGGTRVDVEGGRILSVAPQAHPRGTTLAVRDLFYNTPARRRFLRKPGTEMGHILELFSSLALSRPGTRFRLGHGQRRLFDLPPAPDVRTRLGQIEGIETSEGASEILMETESVVIRGFVVPGESGRRLGTRRLVVNGRVVRDRLLLRAISRATEEVLPSGTPLACMLSLRLPPEEVDVNVHPAKTEVRFRDPQSVFRLVERAVTACLRDSLPGRAGPAPGALSIEADSYAPQRDGGLAFALESYQGRREATAAPIAWPRSEAAPLDSLVAEPGIPQGRPVVIGNYRNGYILAEEPGGLIVVDQHAAHERILFEILGESDERRPGQIQTLLFPRTVQPPARWRDQIASLTADLNSLGFDSEPFGEGTLVVRGVPAALSESDPGALVGEILAAAGEGSEAGPAGIEGRRRRMLATAACHAAVKVTASLAPEKTAWIVSRLLECRSPAKCPHGRPTILRGSHRELERRFGRP